MSMDKEINDALSQKLGDVFQQYVATLDFFRIKDVNKITLEKHGDITIYTSSKTIQKEVKHHITSDRLTNKDIDFWKTLYNWLQEYDKSLTYNDLVLYTTSVPSFEGVFEKWDMLNQNQRFDELKALSHKPVQQDKKNYDYYYNQIFEGMFSDGQVKNILERICIIKGSNNIYNLKDDFYPYLQVLDTNEKKDSVIVSMVGFVIHKATTDSEEWTITKDDFFKNFQESCLIRMNDFGIPDRYKDMIIDSDLFKIYEDKVFVQKIRDIDLEKRVSDAVNDYWRTMNTITDYVQQDISKSNIIKSYKNDIENILSNKRDQKLINVSSTNKKDIIDKSKDFYYDMMTRQLEPIGKLLNYRFFQNGTIHTIMDETDMKWYLGEENDNEN